MCVCGKEKKETLSESAQATLLISFFVQTYCLGLQKYPGSQEDSVVEFHIYGQKLASFCSIFASGTAMSLEVLFSNFANLVHNGLFRLILSVFDRF